MAEGDRGEEQPSPIPRKTALKGKATNRWNHPASSAAATAGGDVRRGPGPSWQTEKLINRGEEDGTREDGVSGGVGGFLPQLLSDRRREATLPVAACWSSTLLGAGPLHLQRPGLVLLCLRRPALSG